MGNAVLEWYSIFIFGKARLSSTKQPLTQYFQHSSHVRKILYVFSRSQSRFSGFGRKNKKPHKPYNKFSMMMWYTICPEEKNTGRMWSKRTWSDNSTTTDKTLVRVDMIPCAHPQLFTPSCACLLRCLVLQPPQTHHLLSLSPCAQGAQQRLLREFTTPPRRQPDNDTCVSS